MAGLLQESRGIDQEPHDQVTSRVLGRAGAQANHGDPKIWRRSGNASLTGGGSPSSRNTGREAPTHVANERLKALDLENSVLQAISKLFFFNKKNSRTKGSASKSQ